MKSIRFVGHLFAGTFGVWWLSLMATGVGYGLSSPFLSSASTPQQFYSAHLMLLVVVVGVLFAYVMCGTFPDTSAQWVWVPATMAFLIRVIDWHATGSVLTGAGSLVEHFFTANCQIQNYSEAGFDTRCFDKLFVTPLWIGPLAYSAGAVIHRVTARRHRLGHESALRTATIPGRSRIVTTRLGALLAILITGSSLGFRFRTKTAETFSWTMFGSNVWPSWVNVPLNIAIWGGICLIGIGFIRAPLPKTEKAMFGAYTANVMLVLVSGLLPRLGGAIQVLQTLLCLTSFLAALAILLSFWNRQAPSESS